MRDVKISKTYITSDGKRFKNKDKAYLHQLAIRFTEFCNTHGVDMLGWVLQHHEEAIEIGEAVESFIKIENRCASRRKKR